MIYTQICYKNTIIALVCYFVMGQNDVESWHFCCTDFGLELSLEFRHHCNTFNVGAVKHSPCNSAKIFRKSTSKINLRKLK